MSEDTQIRLDSSPNTELVLDRWLECLSQVVESMTEQRPELRWKAFSGPADELGFSFEPGSDTLWWEQPLSLAPDFSIWVAAPRGTWLHAGTATLKAAGLETIEQGEARNTWFEILAQSLASIARTVSSVLKCEVTAEQGIERAPGTDLREWASVQFTMGGVALNPLLVGFSPKLSNLVSAPYEAPETSAGAVEIAPVYESSRTMDLLMDVDLPVSISFGKAQLPLRDVVKLTTGSIVELDRTVNEQVEVLVNQRLIARGEVVVVDGNYGVRILEIASPQDRMRSIR